MPAHGTAHRSRGPAFNVEWKVRLAKQIHHDRRTTPDFSHCGLDGENCRLDAIVCRSSRHSRGGIFCKSNDRF